MFPKPLPSQVIRYSYLWNAEHLRGQEEGVKDRPCAIVVSITNDIGKEAVTVLPVTHTPPRLAEMDLAIEIPVNIKRRLGLDDSRSWIMLTEANRFTWPGPDLRMAINGDTASTIYGLLPEYFFKHMRDRFLVALERSKSTLIPRSE